jgi:hypothetical protein
MRVGPMRESRTLGNGSRTIYIDSLRGNLKKSSAGRLSPRRPKRNQGGIPVAIHAETTLM